MVTGHAPSSKPSATETFYELAIRTTFDETTTLHFFFFFIISNTLTRDAYCDSETISMSAHPVITQELVSMMLYSVKRNYLHLC